MYCTCTCKQITYTMYCTCALTVSVQLKRTQELADSREADLHKLVYNVPTCIYKMYVHVHNVCVCLYVHYVLKAGHVFTLCLHVCIVRMWCFGSEFSFFTTNLASVLYTCVFMYIVHTCIYCTCMAESLCAQSTL